MSEVTWLSHPRYDAYEVSADGRVRSKGRFVHNRWGGQHWRAGQPIAISDRKGGAYRGGNISIDGERVNFDLHVFVCETFHGPKPSPLHEVRHLNGDGTDNRAENLAWGTKTENAQDIIRHGHNHELNKTRCRRNHEFTPENTYRAPSAPNKRKCRKCMAINDAKRPTRRRTSIAA